jgi:hypothetical protein
MKRIFLKITLKLSSNKGLKSLKIVTLIKKKIFINKIRDIFALALNF